MDNIPPNVLNIILFNLSQRVQELLERTIVLEKDIEAIKLEITSIKRYHDYNI
jgi:hypothetical protein